MKAGQTDKRSYLHIYNLSMDLSGHQNSMKIISKAKKTEILFIGPLCLI